MRQRKFSRRRVGKKEAQKLFIEHYKDNILAMIQDVNNRARKTLKLGGKDSWKYRIDPSKYDISTIDDGSKKAYRWILNQAYHNLANNNHINIDQSEVLLLKEQIKDEKNNIKILKHYITELKNYNKNTEDQETKNTCNELTETLREKLKICQKKEEFLNEALRSVNEKISLIKQEHEQKVSDAVLSATANYARIIQEKTEFFKIEKQKLENSKLEYEKALLGSRAILETEREKVKSKNAAIIELKKQINSISEKIKKCNQETDNSRNNYAQEYEKYKKQAEQNEQQLLNLTEKYESLQKKHEITANKLSENEKKISVFEQKVKENELTQQAMERIQKQLDEALKKNEDYLANINQLKEKSEILKNKIQEKIKKDSEIVKNASQDSEKLKQNIKKVEDELQECIVSKRELMQQLSEIKKEKELNDAMVISLKARITSFESEIKDHKDTIDTLNKKIEVQNQTIEALNKQISDSKEENTKLQEILKNKLAQANESLKNANDQVSLCAQNSKLKDGKIVELETTIKQLTEKNDEFIKKNIQADEKEIIGFKSKISQNENEVVPGRVSINTVGTSYGHLNIIKLYYKKDDNSLGIPLVQQNVSISRIKEYSYKIMFPNQQTDPPITFKIFKDEEESPSAFDIRNKTFMNLLKKNSSFYDNYKISKKL